MRPALNTQGDETGPGCCFLSLYRIISLSLYLINVTCKRFISLRSPYVTYLEYTELGCHGYAGGCLHPRSAPFRYRCWTLPPNTRKYCPSPETGPWGTSVAADAPAIHNAQLDTKYTSIPCTWNDTTYNYTSNINMSYTLTLNSKWLQLKASVSGFMPWRLWFFPTSLVTLPLSIDPHDPSLTVSYVVTVYLQTYHLRGKSDRDTGDLIH